MMIIGRCHDDYREEGHFLRFTLTANATMKPTAASLREGVASSAHLAAGGSSSGASLESAGLASDPISPWSHARASSLTLGLVWPRAPAESK